MVTLETGDLSFVSLVILIIIYFNFNPLEKTLVSNKYFIALIITNMVLIVVDFFGWAFNGLPGALNMVLNFAFNAALYILAPAAPIFWTLYAIYQIHKDEARVRTVRRLMLAVFLINAVISVLSVFHKAYFYIDAQNIYHRGSLFFVYVAFCYAIILITFFYIIMKRDKLEKKHFYSLLLFFVPSSIGIIIQAFSYGVSYNWVGMMLSVLFIYLYIQNRGLNTDYLTGVHNRRQLDGYMKAKIRSSTEASSFSAIMFDLDHFKQINDSFGHETGDEALKDAVSIIRKSLRNNDFLARTGGDEFVAVLDIQSSELLEETVSRIKINMEQFNQEGSRPYSLSVSVGYAVYNTTSKMDRGDFFKHIDQLMYKDKKTNTLERNE